MTYQEIKTALKSFQAQGYEIPALNSKKEILENALAQILASITPEIIEIVEVAIEPEPAVTIEIIAPITPETAVIINPEPAAVAQIKSIAKGLEIALIWAIALVRSLIRFATPRIKTALGISLRFTIFTAALLGYWLVPKIQLVAYSLGIWGLTIALRLIHSRRLAIA